MPGLALGLNLITPTRAGASLPVNTVAPVVSGTTEVGQTLSCTTGTWTGTGVLSYAYQWVNSVSGNIGGATASTYVLQASDEGDNIKCVVTATDDVGSTAADSNTVGPITAVVFSTLNPADKAAAITLSNGNLTATIAGTSNAAVRGTASRATGKYHFEATLNVNPGGGTCGVGVVPSGFSLTGIARFASPGGFVTINGYVNENGGGGINADSWSVVGNTVAIEVDCDTNQFWVEKVGGTGRKGPFTMGTIGDTFPVVGLTTDTDQITVNFGASPFAITPTSGFAAWG